MDFETVLNFWFTELTPAQKFQKNEKVDQDIRTRFLSFHQAAERGELAHWRDSSRGRLAEIIILDQFSRNMFRGQKQSFASDSLALALTQEAIRSGAAKSLTPNEKAFLYMPFMHSESLIVHASALEFFREKGLEGTYDFELKHKAILERFGRYPHRNQILERISTQEELDFLKQPGSSF